MEKNEKLEEMKVLIDRLNEATEVYHNEDREILSNLEYDELYDRLELLEKETGVILSASPTQKVGFEILSGLEKIEHGTKMLSLDKTKSSEALKDFLGDQQGLLSWKLDGLTVVLTYREGKLFSAVTRGNGEIGEDITHNAKFFRNIPLKIDYFFELVIRGEAVISYEEFEKINSELTPEEKYKNPRNLCSGTVRQLNNQTVSKRNVDCVAFQIVEANDVDFGDFKSQQLKWLKELGFEVVEHEKVKADNLESFIEDYKKRSEHNKYASDGLVLTFDRMSYSESLGATARFPKDSMAFKWQDELAETTLIDVVWNTSRTGLINPIAVFEPVEIEGTTVERASLHNVSITESFELGIGDKITVYKANMIIPQVENNLTRSGTLIIPENCPVCMEKAERTMIKEGAVLKCVNEECPSRIIQSMVHFVSRDAMNIEGLSEATLEKFIAKGFIKEYADIFSLKNFADKIKEMEGFGEKSCENILASIEKARDTKLFRVIYGLGIDQIGLSNAKLLCNYYENDVKSIKKAHFEDISQIDGFGPIIAMSIRNFFMNDVNKSGFEKILSAVNIDLSVDNTEKTLVGLTFVITGDLNIYENRDKLKEEIESLGGKVTGSVSSKTDYLINNDVASNSSKNKKAKELDIPIISEEDFKSKFNN